MADRDVPDQGDLPQINLDRPSSLRPRGEDAVWNNAAGTNNIFPPEQPILYPKIRKKQVGDRVAFGTMYACSTSHTWYSVHLEKCVIPSAAR
jgi:hypothetical protein